MASYQIETLKLRPDYEGENKATLIRAEATGEKRGALLYIHGFIDYFFQDHLADWFVERNFDFYALELRKYGRSLMPHQSPNHVFDIREYFEEIDEAIDRICKRDGHESFILMGHSTGGLISVSYANWGEKKACISKLILNSPFLELNVPDWMRRAFMPLIAPWGKLFPFLRTPMGLSSIYGKSIHKDYWGEWDFNPKYKPVEGFPVYLGWMRAIYRQQRAVKKKSDIRIPILLLHSEKSSVHSGKHPEIFTTDIVLNVNHMKKIGPKLGADVQLVAIKGAVHDVFLSREKPRNEAFKAIKTWLGI